MTYLYGRGVHQYLTNNIGAPEFATADLGIYPANPLPPHKRTTCSISPRRLPARSNYRFRQGQLPRFSFFTFYTYTAAKADTNGVTYTPSVLRIQGSTMDEPALMFTTAS